ncbi:VanZ family protein [Staphylococcus chromogenes]|nr:VanZ family protein [Staphylococcus chromogenes]
MPRNFAAPYRDAKKSDVLVVLYYLPALILLTLLKGVFVIGHLWRKTNHHIREVQVVPFNDLWASKSWFGSLFNIFGNMVLFIPLGMLAYMLLRDVKRTALLGFVVSAAIEAAQYIFALGVTDTDDLILNTAGAALGAGLVKLTGERVERLWRWACILFATIIYVLYLLGPRLGSEEKMTPVAAPAPASAPAPVHKVSDSASGVPARPALASID